MNLTAFEAHCNFWTLFFFFPPQYPCCLSNMQCIFIRVKMNLAKTNEFSLNYQKLSDIKKKSANTGQMNKLKYDIV